MTDIEGNMMEPVAGENAIPVASALENAPKTFLEKRSWFRGMLALNRILEWHLVTFYLLAVVAFARELVWGWVYSIQVGSGIFWIFNALHLFWALKNQKIPEPTCMEYTQPHTSSRANATTARR